MAVKCRLVDNHNRRTFSFTYYLSSFKVAIPGFAKGVGIHVMKFVAGSAESRCASKPHGSKPNLRSRTTKLILEIRMHYFSHFAAQQDHLFNCSKYPEPDRRK